MSRFVRLAGAALALLLLVAASLPSGAAELRFPALTGRVVDEAGILSPGAEARIGAWLAGLESARRYQVVVVTMPSLQGATIADYGYQLGRHWGIGEAGRNTGALLIVAPNQREVRIEVGYGLEGELTDATSRIIIERDILPAFRSGSYEQGILAGTVAILRTLGYSPDDAPLAVQPSSEGDSPLELFLLIVAVVVMVWLHRRGGFGLGSGPIVPWRGGARRRSGFDPTGFGSFGRGGGSGGGFRGGGGSFGGGGASGRW